jgi:hypothetical protein
MKKLSALFLGSALTLASGAALAQQQWGGTYQPAMPAPRSSGIDNLGEEQQFVFGVDRVMGVSWDRATQEPDGGETTSKATNVNLFATSGNQSLLVPTTNFPRLALDFFVTEGVSLGGSFFFMSSSLSQEQDPDPNNVSGDVGTLTTWGISPRVGYAYAIDETFSIWPRLGITYMNTNFEDDDGNEQNLNALELTAEVMFGISPFSHFAILIGPFLDLGLSGNAKSKPNVGDSSEVDTKLTSFGLAVSIVGYY